MTSNAPLIKSIEIRRFRSLEHVVLGGLNHLSVIFGENDSGKSNVLRALNLFFNGETNPGVGFNWARDFTARSTSQRGPAITVTLNVPPSYRHSLGKELYLRRLWSRDGSVNERFTRNANPASVKRLFKKISYHHIPAIKDTRIFQELLGRIYATLVQDSAFGESLDNFAREVQTHTSALSQSIESGVGMNSLLAPPTDLEGLFRTLDFFTGPGATFSLLLQRGDGVKVRHIPELLRFIGQRQSSQLHVWGFEEPENSLSYASALKEADRFVEASTDVARQVFVTSHSPAFYNLRGATVARFHVSKDDGVPDRSDVSRLEPGDRGEELMDDLPYLVTLANGLAEVQQRIADRDASLAALRSDLKKLRTKEARSNLPLLFVEGESDAILLKAAFAALRPDSADVVDIRAAGGCERLKAFRYIAKELRRSLFGQRDVAILVDNDSDGRDCFTSSRLNKRPERFTRDDASNWWARLKPTPEYVRFASDAGLSSYEFTIEHLLTDEVARAAHADGVLQFAGPCPTTMQALGKRFSDRYVDELTELSADPATKRFLFKPHKDSKAPLAKWVAGTYSDITAFSNFEPCVAGIEALCSDLALAKERRAEHRARADANE